MRKIYKLFAAAAFAVASISANAAEMPTEWRALGEATFTDDITTLFENYEAPVYKVAVEQAADGSAWYRLVNPFASHPEADSWSACETIDGDFYIVIDATDPNRVVVPMMAIGLSAYDDELSLATVSEYPDYEDLWLDADEAASMVGRLDGNEIIFDVSESFVLVSTFGAEQANLDGLTKIELPKSGDPEPPVDAQTPPFSETFADASFIDTFTIVNSNGDDNQWSPYLGSAQISFNADMAMDDWLITPPLALEADKKYVLTIDVMTGNGSALEAFEIKAGSAPNPESMTSTVIDRKEVAHTVYKSYGGVITPDATGVYYVGIHGCSAAGTYSLSVKNLVIEQGAEASAPSAPTGITITTHTYGALKADISLIAPSVDLAGNQLAAIEKVTLKRDGTEIHVFEAPQLGETLKWTDEVDACARYTYSATATVNGIESAEVSTTGFVGVLAPAPVTGITIAEDEDPGWITLSWLPVTTDIRGNNLDSEYVTYRIYTAGQNTTPIFSGITTATYSFKAIDDVEQQQFIRYEVVAETLGGISDFASSDNYAIGKPYETPYAESFANGAVSSIMANSLTNTANWRVYIDDGDITAQDGDDGLLVSEAHYFEDKASWESGKISLENVVEPKLTFWVYALKDNFEDDMSTIAVSVKEGSKTTAIRSWVIATLPGNEGWQMMELNLNGFKGKTIQLVFTATHDTMRYILMDNVKLFDSIASAIGDIVSDNENTAPVEYFNLQGIRVVNPTSGVYIRRQGNTVTKIIM